MKKKIFSFIINAVFGQNRRTASNEAISDRKNSKILLNKTTAIFLIIQLLIKTLLIWGEIKPKKTANTFETYRTGLC